MQATLSRLVAFAVLSPLVAQNVDWQQLSPRAQPSARQAHAMAYDEARSRVLLFGGDDGQLLADTWLWSGGNWTRARPSTEPPARRDHALVYDPIRQRVVMFGGVAGERRLADVWEWSGSEWRECATARGPTPRAGHAMVFDVRLGEVLLFGGRDERSLLADSWLWDGEEWAQLQPASSPPARDGHAMCYDPVRKHVVLFGGEGEGGLLADTWRWDGRDWQSVDAPSQITARTDHAMAFDFGHRCATVVGGRGEQGPLADSWSFDGETWRPLQVEHGPAARSGHALVFEPRAFRLLAFGGRGAEYSDETWTLQSVGAFDNQAWNTAIGLGGGAGGRYGGRGGGRAGRHGGKACAAAIEAGLVWLGRHQDASGGFGGDVGDTSLALLAFLGDGSTMRSGPFKTPIKNAVKWLRMRQRADGRFGSAADGDSVCDHAIAAYAMCEAYGLSNYKLLKKCAQGGLDYLESVRDPQSVWRREQGDRNHDVEVTGWAILANETAGFFGLDVNRAAQERCLAFLDSIADATTTAVDTRGNRERPEVLAAVGLFSRFMIGQSPKETPIMRVAADLVRAQPPVADAAQGAVDPYYWYYGTYALYQFGGTHWRDWQRRLRPAVIDRQHAESANPDRVGSWDPVGTRGGSRVRTTALLSLTLEAYYRYSRLVR